MKRAWCRRCHLEQTYQEGWGRLWNTVRALKTVKDREPAPIRVEQFRSLMAFTQVDPKHLPHVDLTKPLLIGTVVNYGRPILILLDGLHRTCRALDRGIRSLPALTLTANETTEVEVE